MTQIIILDAAGIIDLVSAGDAGFASLRASGSHFITTHNILDEISEGIRSEFLNWADGRNDFEVQDIDIDLSVDSPEGRSLGLGVRANGTLSQQGDASIRWLEREFGIISDGSHIVLSNDGGLIDWANRTSPEGVRGGYSTTVEMIGEALLNGEIDGNQYNTAISNLENRIANNYPEDFRSLVFSESDVSALADVEARGVSLSTLGGVGTLGVLFEGIRQLGMAGDVVALAATSIQAAALEEAGDHEAASKLWVEYSFETAGGTLLSGASAYAGLSAGPWAALGLGLVGGIAGSFGGKAIGGWLYDLNPDLFEPLVGGRLDPNSIEFEGRQWLYTESSGWIGYTGTHGDIAFADATTLSQLQSFQQARIVRNAALDVKYNTAPLSEIEQSELNTHIDGVIGRVFGLFDGQETLHTADGLLDHDLFSLGGTDFSNAYAFDISTTFYHGNQGLETQTFGSDFSSILNDGLLISGGNWNVSSVTANTPGYWVEMNAAISDGHQPGRNNIIDSTASDIVPDIFSQASLGGGFINQYDFYAGASGIAYLSGWSSTIAEIDPLILDLDGDGIELLPFSDNFIFFDVDNDGNVERTGWVGSDDGILVHDLNGDGIINDITETLSEYYTAATGTGAIWGSGFEALATLDSNSDGQITSADALWDDLRIWIDANSNGYNDAGELVTLDAQGVTSLSLSDSNDGAFISGNEVKSNSTYVAFDGSIRTLASVNFIADPSGFSGAFDGDGTRFDLETGGALYAVGSDAGEDVDLTAKAVTSAMGGAGDDTLRGDAQDNWLVGSLGVDQLFGGAGNDYLISDAADIELTQANVNGGQGFDIIQFVGDRGVVFNLQDSQVEMAIGTDHADILSSGSTDHTIINGGLGHDLLIGGSADDVLNGEEGDDAIYGHDGDDLIRGHRGSDQLMGGAGNDIIQGGLGDDQLLGNEGEDLLDGGAGNDALDGGDGYDVAEYTGSYADYRITYNADESVTITDQRTDGDGIDRLYNIEALNFSDINEITIDGENPLPVKDVVRINADADGTYRIAISDLLANDLDYQGDSLIIRDVFGAKGGVVALDGNEIIFTPEDDFVGVPFFSYRVQDAKGNNGLQIGVVGTAQTAEMSAQVTLVLDEHPHDPQFIDQWYLPEINVLPVWEDYTGAGVTIGVFEIGPWDAETYGKIDYDHPDLRPNIDAEELRTANPNIEPTQHATLVAGVIAAARNNIGGIGVAYDAVLTSKGITEADLNPLFDWANVDVANNSWGPEGLFGNTAVDQNGVSVGKALLEDAIRFGREGLGTVVVFSGGNNRINGHDTNAKDLTSSHLAVTVGAVNAEGDLGNLQLASAPFSNPGASILVSAPGSNVVSTSRLVENDNGSTFGSHYEAAQGTSFAAPIVSGVVALMLEANPNLGWRDVQEILALSAKQIDDPNTEWQTNGATTWNGGGMHFSRDYGFGLVDARAAVRLAETWQAQKTSLNEYEIHADEAGFSITDGGIDADKVTTFISGSIDIETIEITLDIGHTRMGDLEITLISPTGTRSRLLDRPGVGPEDPDGYDAYSGTWSLTSRHFRGEDSAGLWTLEVHDKVTGETGTINSWKLQAYGAADGDNDVYIYTDEFSSAASQNIPSVLSDNLGYNTINTSAVSSDVTVNLSGANDSLVAGRQLILSPGTKIDAVYTGDGNDTVIGNENANYLSGGRGNDSLFGHGGNDILVGGRGDDVLYGAEGDDKFYWRQGDGNDIVVALFNGAQQQAAVGQGKDTLILSGVTSDEIDFIRSSHSLFLHIEPSGEIVTISDIYVNWIDDQTAEILDNYAVDFIQLDDGTAWDLSTLKYQISHFNGTDGDDTLVGTPGDDTFLSNKGNDTYFGSDGDDKYIWNRGDGNDIIDDGNGENILKFTDINSEDIAISTTIYNHVELLIKSTGETIRLRNQIEFEFFNNDKTHPSISKIEFADGAIWNIDDITRNTFTRGTDGDDFISSNQYRGETVIAGLGNDTIHAIQGGSDRVIYNSGDGNDIIHADSDDVIVFSDLLMKDVVATRVGDDAKILIKPTGQVVTLIDGFATDQGPSNSLGPNKVTDFASPDIEFSDGKITSAWELQENPGLFGSNFGDNITSYYDNTSIYGLSGDDYLKSGVGSAKLFGGDGDDFLFAFGGDEGNPVSTEFNGGNGFNHLYGSRYSSDTYYMSSLEGTQMIYNERDFQNISIDTLVLNQGINASNIEWSVFLETDLIMRVSGTDYAAIPPAFVELMDLFFSDPNLVGQAINLDGFLVDYLLENLETEGLTRASLLEIFGIQDQSITVIPVDNLNSAYDAYFADEILNIQIVDWFVDPLAQLDEIQLFDGTVVEIPDHIKALQPGLIIGDDTVNDVLTGTSQSERIDGGGGDDAISALEGNDKILGGLGNDTLNGGAGNDQLYGNDGDDFIDFGAGDDYASGGAGADTFIFRVGYGNDEITYFEGGAGVGDVVEFDSSLAADYAALQAFMDDFGGPDTVIDFGGGDSLTLQGITLTDLHADDFRFVA